MIKLVITDVVFDDSNLEDTWVINEDFDYVLRHEEVLDDLYNSVVNNIYNFPDEDTAEEYLADIISEETGFTVKYVRYEIV